MNQDKAAYIEAIRADTAYPAYRNVIGLITLALRISAAVVAVSTIVVVAQLSDVSTSAKLLSAVGGLMTASLISLFAEFLKDATRILADIGDSIIESNASVTTPLVSQPEDSCDRCGAPNDPNHKFCIRCGAELHGGGATKVRG